MRRKPHVNTNGWRVPALSPDRVEQLLHGATLPDLTQQHNEGLSMMTGGMVYARGTNLLWHPREKTCGEARVIFDEGYGISKPPGWWLPGGRRTDDEDEAMRAARAIAQIMNENPPVQRKPVQLQEREVWG